MSTLDAWIKNDILPMWAIFAEGKDFQQLQMEVMFDKDGIFSGNKIATEKGVIRVDDIEAFNTIRSMADERNIEYKIKLRGQTQIAV